MASDRESIQVTYHGTSDSGKAYKVSKVGSLMDPVWVPVSQCDFIPSDPEQETDCWLMIPLWLATKSGLA